MHKKLFTKSNFRLSKLILTTSLAPITILHATAATNEKTHHLPVTSHHQVPFKKYSDSNVEFTYPSSWNPKEANDKETIIKLAGNITNGVTGELTVNVNQNESVDAETLSTLATIYLKKLDDFKVIQEKKVTFGQSRKIEGLLKDVSFTMNGIPIFQRLVFFDGPKGAYSCNFLTTNKQVKSAAPSFNRILLSFKFNDRSSRSTDKSNKRETEFIKAKHAPISFSYPNGWKVEETTGDKSIELNGKDKAGRPATIAIYKGAMHPYTNLAQVAQALEKEHLSPKNKYRRLNSQSKTFGNMSKIHGIVQECKFETDGVSYNQLVAYFNDSTHAYIVSMASPNWKLSEMRRTFHKVLASMKMKH